MNRFTLEPSNDYHLLLNNIYQDAHLENLPEWNTIIGLQFENLVLNNLATIIKKLHIAPETIISAVLYFQSETTRQSAVQIDLLIHRQYTLFICEIKFRKEIGTEVIDQMIDKIKRLKVPEHLSVRPALIYQGKLSDTVKKSNYFSNLIPLDTKLPILLTPNPLWAPVAAFWGCQREDFLTFFH